MAYCDFDPVTRKWQHRLDEYVDRHRGPTMTWDDFWRMNVAFWEEFRAEVDFDRHEYVHGRFPEVPLEVDAQGRYR